jgi:hypothetical protein
VQEIRSNLFSSWIGGYFSSSRFLCDGCIERHWLIFCFQSTQHLWISQDSPPTMDSTIFYIISFVIATVCSFVLGGWLIDWFGWFVVWTV